LLLSLGLCGLALSIVLLGWGLLTGNSRLLELGVWYPPLSLLALLLRWILLRIRKLRRREAEGLASPATI
jgi:hypothetical protein